MAKNADSTLDLSGRLTVRTIAEAKEEILAALKANRSLKLTIDGDSEADISGIQLILAAQTYASGLSKKLSLTAPISGRVRSIIEEGGFLAVMSADDRHFWLHEGV